MCLDPRDFDSYAAFEYRKIWMPRDVVATGL